MIETFTVDGLNYELRINAVNEITLTIVSGGNPAYQPETYDPFDYWDYVPHVTADIGCTRYPFRVHRAVLARLHHWLGPRRAHAFNFRAVSERRRWLYERTARRLAERFDYDLQIIGDTYRCYRLKRT